MSTNPFSAAQRVARLEAEIRRLADIENISAADDARLDAAIDELEEARAEALLERKNIANGVASGRIPTAAGVAYPDFRGSGSSFNVNRGGDPWRYGRFGSERGVVM